MMTNRPTRASSFWPSLFDGVPGSGLYQDSRRGAFVYLRHPGFLGSNVRPVASRPKKRANACIIRKTSSHEVRGTNDSGPPATRTCSRAPPWHASHPIPTSTSESPSKRARTTSVAAFATPCGDPLFEARAPPSLFVSVVAASSKALASRTCTLARFSTGSQRSTCSP